MADPNTRQGKRTPVTLKIKFKSETLEQFIERYAVDVSQGGIFIRTKEPLAVGTQMKFEFQLRDASPLIAGEGTVVWTRENDPSRPAIAPGMGVRFDKLADGSQNVLERILAEKAKQAPSRGNESPTKPPMFTDTPTRVAPAPVQEALGVRGRRREDSEQTPLPKPMPFHSDAEDFDERAFEEATKVRSLDELAAQSAGLLGGDDEVSDDQQTSTKVNLPADELAARRQQGRADSTLADPPGAEPQREATSPGVGAGKAVPDRDSAPGLPSPPETSRPRMLDTTPSPRSESRPQPGVDDASQSQRTKLGMEPAKAATSARAAASDASAIPRAVSAETSPRPVAPKRPSSAPIVIGILLVVGAAMAAVWYFVIRVPETTDQEIAAKKPDTTGAGSTTTTNPKPDTTGSAGSAVEMTGTGSDTTGSAGSAVAMTGSAGSAAVVVPTPGAKVVDTVVASSVAKGAMVEIVGTDQKGPAPFTAKLEQDRAYKAHVTAPGFVGADLDVKGGQEKLVAKLVAKPKVLSVTTEPAGADILIDGVSTQKLSPAEVQLTPAQAARPRVRVTLRRPGYRPVDQFLETGAFTEGDAKLTVSVEAKLTVAPKPTGGAGGGTGGTGGGTTTTNNNAGSGATTPSGGGTGSATPSGGGTTTPPAGGTTTPPAGGTTTPAGGTTTTPAGGTTTTPAGGTTTPAPKPTTPSAAGTTTAPKPPAGTGTGSATAPAGGTLQ